MLLEIFIMWGCVDLKDCFSAGDLSNIASTYIGIIVGAFIGGFISWLDSLLLVKICCFIRNFIN
jgi:hypothetical protein